MHHFLQKTFPSVFSEFIFFVDGIWIVIVVAVVAVVVAVVFFSVIIPNKTSHALTPWNSRGTNKFHRLVWSSNTIQTFTPSLSLSSSPSFWNPSFLSFISLANVYPLSPSQTHTHSEILNHPFYFDSIKNIIINVISCLLKSIS